MAATRPRTVNDYTSPQALRQALQSVDEERSLSDDSGISHASYSRRGRMDVSSTAVRDEREILDENWDWVLTNYDVGTTKPQSISQELHRLQVLKSYLLLDQDREEAFERFTNMASRVFGVPIALVSLVDVGRQWFMSNLGLGDVRETPRSIAFCAHAIQGKNDVFVVKNTLDDPRFCDSPLVKGAPFIRFYAGAPLLSPEGYKLGTFCIIDSKPRPDGLSPDDQANLIDFASMAMKAMVDRRQISAQDDTGHLLACTAHDLLTPLMGVQLSLSLMQEDAELLTEAHRESLSNATRSSDLLHRICQTTMETLRDSRSAEAAKTIKECPLLNLSGAHTRHLASTGEMPPCTCSSHHHGVAQNDNEEWPVSPFIDMEDFVTSLSDTMESIPKRVPLIMTVADSVPKIIVSDDLKLFRSSLNLISSAFSNTTAGSVKFHIRAEQQYLVFECTDTGKDLQIDEEDIKCLFKPCKKSLGVTRDLGLYSVAYQIDSLGGSYGYRSRTEEGRHGSVFWFHVPIVLPDDVSLAPSITERSGMDLMETLDSSVVHFPAIAIPKCTTTTTEARDHQHHPHQQVHRVLSAPNSRRNSNATEPDQRTLNRSGFRAVTSAAAKAMPQSTSCCGLDELANYKDIETYKACQKLPRRKSRSNSLTQSTTASSINSSAISSSLERLHRSRSLDNANITLRKPPLPNITIVTTNNNETKPAIDETGSANREAAVEALRVTTEKQQGKDSNQNNAPSLAASIAGLERVTQKSAPSHRALLQQKKAAPLIPAPTGSKLVLDKAPFLLKENAAEPGNGDAQQNEAPRQKRALVIEDTLVVRKTLTRALQKRGYEVTQAVDGLEGLDALKRTIFDITLCDFLMPNMDGLDCIQQYRQWEQGNRTFQQHIVGISAHVSKKDIAKGLEIGMNDFRPKPITIKTLKELDECPAMDRARDMLSTMGNPEADQSLPESDAASTPKGRSCLMATTRSHVESGETAKKMTSAGWQITIADSGSSALEQLKSRNWGVVILDDDLPSLSGNQCVEEFRVWESQNRVNRQHNLFIVCTDVLLANPETKMLPPAGFDGAVDSQMSWSHIQSMIAKQTHQSMNSMRGGLSIVTR